MNNEPNNINNVNNTNSSTNTTSNINNTNNVNTNTSTVNTTTTNHVATTSAPNINPAISNIKDSQSINTSAFAKSDGPRIETESSPATTINASAYTAANKKEKKIANVEEKPAKSKAGVIIFLILLMGFVIFLPNITKLVGSLNNGVNNENVTTGELRCSLKKTTDNFDITYEQNIPFKDNELESLKFITTTKGDVTKDKNELEDLDATCNKLSELASEIKGMEVNCEFAGDKMIETHNIEYNDLDLSAMKSAYTETGGTAPEFTYRDNIDDVQKQLQAVGYKCKKIK